MTCKQYTIELDPSESAAIVSYPVADFVAQKAVFTANDDNNQLRCAYELFLSYTQELNVIEPQFVMYAGVGDDLSYTIDAVYNNTTSSIEVQLVNTGATRLRFDFSEQGTIV